MATVRDPKLQSTPVTAADQAAYEEAVKAYTAAERKQRDQEDQKKADEMVSWIGELERKEQEKVERAAAEKQWLAKAEQEQAAREAALKQRQARAEQKAAALAQRREREQRENHLRRLYGLRLQQANTAFAKMAASTRLRSNQSTALSIVFSGLGLIFWWNAYNPLGGLMSKAFAQTARGASEDPLRYWITAGCFVAIFVLFVVCVYIFVDPKAKPSQIKFADTTLKGLGVFFLGHLSSYLR
ncbi:MAG: hypothetical protein U1E60_14670 [Reyranellaceae bacterium]